MHFLLLNYYFSCYSELSFITVDPHIKRDIGYNIYHENSDLKFSSLKGHLQFFIQYLFFYICILNLNKLFEKTQIKIFYLICIYWFNSFCIMYVGIAFFFKLHNQSIFSF